MRRLKNNAGTIADAATGAVGELKGQVNDLKAEYAPSKIVNGIKHSVKDLKEEYDPKKVIVKNPLGVVAGAVVAGFVFVPVLRTIVGSRPVAAPAASTSTSRTLTFPTPGPHHLVIEVKGATPAAAQKPQLSLTELAMEAFAAFGGMQGLLAYFSPQPGVNSVIKPVNKAATPPSAPVQPAEASASDISSASISRRFAPPPSES